jgi:inward rectifier potassium channel
MARRNISFADEVVVLGAEKHFFRDLYHALLKANWWQVIGLITGLFLLVNVFFACSYLAVGGLVNARAGNFADAFFFSVQTMGTIGYGSVYPGTLAANLLVTSEAVVGLLVMALSTGLIFQRFSQPRAEVVFSKCFCISLVDGVPTLMGRLGNDRSDPIVNAEIHIDAVRTVKTAEGHLLYRSSNLKLVRDRAISLFRTWNVMHTIDESSPLYNVTPASATADELELSVLVTGIDGVTNQQIHARCRYETHEILFGARPVDLLRERSDGKFELDIRKFDHLEPTPATPTFPYHWEERHS